MKVKIVNDKIFYKKILKYIIFFCITLGIDICFCDKLTKLDAICLNLIGVSASIFALTFSMLSIISIKMDKTYLGKNIAAYVMNESSCITQFGKILCCSFLLILECLCYIFKRYLSEIAAILILLYIVIVNIKQMLIIFDDSKIKSNIKKNIKNSEINWDDFTKDFKKIILSSTYDLYEDYKNVFFNESENLIKNDPQGAKKFNNNVIQIISMPYINNQISFMLFDIINCSYDIISKTNLEYDYNIFDDFFLKYKDVNFFNKCEIDTLIKIDIFSLLCKILACHKNKQIYNCNDFNAVYKYIKNIPMLLKKCKVQIDYNGYWYHNEFMMMYKNYDMKFFDTYIFSLIENGFYENVLVHIAKDKTPYEDERYIFILVSFYTYSLQYADIKLYNQLIVKFKSIINGKIIKEKKLYLREADNCFFGDDFILKFMKRLSFLMDAGIIVENNNYNYLLLAFYIGIMAFYDEDITDYIDKLNEELIEMLNEFYGCNTNSIYYKMLIEASRWVMNNVFNVSFSLAYYTIDYFQDLLQGVASLYISNYILQLKEKYNKTVFTEIFNKKLKSDINIRLNKKTIKENIKLHPKETFFSKVRIPVQYDDYVSTFNLVYGKLKVEITKFIKEKNISEENNIEVSDIEITKNIVDTIDEQKYIYINNKKYKASDDEYKDYIEYSGYIIEIKFRIESFEINS